MNGGDLVIVYALYGSEDAADDAARDAVESGLAACANRLAPCQSTYRWEGAVEQAAEIAVLFKTSASARDALMARLAAGHDYDVPAILSWAVDAVHPPYLAWALAQVTAARSG
ncbi:divalent-cation tolerance protein CutA [Sphingobium aquiterrae]|uniref:divalent-cation tolerance protein CutA n=1 Tax=Sphingobium aquiterrae TaxID=2038656 RepID=UPI003015B5B8